MVGRTLKDGCEQSMLCILQYDAGYRIEWYSGARLCGAPTLRWLYSFPTCPAASNSGRNPKEGEILFFATEMSPLDLNFSKKLRNSSFFFFPNLTCTQSNQALRIEGASKDLRRFKELSTLVVYSGSRPG